MRRSRLGAPSRLRSREVDEIGVDQSWDTAGNVSQPRPVKRA